MGVTTERPQSFSFDDVRVEPAAFRLWKAGRPVAVEPKALEVLIFLIENRGRVVQKSELLDAVWKGAFVTENALTREIALLRKALGEEARRAKYIETVPTRGYRFIAEVTNGAAVEDEARTDGARPDGARPAALTNAATEEVRPQAGAEPRASSHAPSRADGAGDAPRSWPRNNLRRLAGFAALAVLVLAAGFAAARFFRAAPSRVGEPFRVKRLTQLTTSVGLDTYPAISPDGAYVAYASDRGGGFEIYVRQITLGGREIQVTSDGGRNFQPAWSPDGQRLAFHSQARGGVWVAPALGGVARRLTSFGSRPAWSPDGESIAFTSAALTDFIGQAGGALPPATLWVVPSRGGEPRQVTRPGEPSGGHGSPVWWPGGERLLFFAYDVMMAEVWSVGLDGGGLKRLAADVQNLNDLIFAPDGRHVFCTGFFKGASFGLWRIPVSLEAGEATGDPERIEGTGDTPIRHLSVSADGKRLAYSAVSLASDIWRVPLDPTTGGPAGPAAALYEDTSLRKTHPAVSPDGRRVAFSVYRFGAPGSIWVMDADGRNPAPVTADDLGVNLPYWMPGGERLAYASRREGRAALWVKDLRTGEERLLRELGREVMMPRLSPDGRTVAFNSRQNGGLINVWTMAAEGDAGPRQLTFDREMAGFPAWSPDGRWLAVEIKRGDDDHIAVIPSEGGEAVQLTRGSGLNWPHSFSPDGDRIAFAGRREGVWNVYWVSRSTGEERRLTNFTRPNTYVRYPSWSPRGDQIVFERGEATGNVWLLELK
jgi:Tol biopolymer transport system component/DNA-binding winged helix-turn-helix (wHTH) protein